MAGRKRNRKASSEALTDDVTSDTGIDQCQSHTPSSTSTLSSGNKKKRKLQQQANGTTNHHTKSIHPTIPISKSDHDATLTLLKTMDWQMAKNTSRRNVIRSDDPSTPRNSRNKPYCMSFIFGRNMKDPTGGLSWWSTKYPEVYAQLQALMNKYDPSFQYTHITLNRNLRCKRHTDGGNAGLSYIAGFGSYNGGELLVEQPPGGGGRKSSETILNLNSTFVMFNGKTQPHETLPFTGERFTLVYYTSDIEPEEGAIDRRRVLGSVATDGAATTGSVEGGMSSILATKFHELKAKLGRKKKK